MQFLSSLSLILLTTLILGQVSLRLKLPLVVGQLLAGIIMGPTVCNWVQPSHWLQLFSDIGVILLMFLAGLESKIDLLKKYLKPSMVVAVSGILLPVAVGYLIGLMFEFTKFESLFLGIVFAATSVSISAEVLQEMDSLTSREGTTILGAAVVDDILAVLLVSMISNLNIKGTVISMMHLGILLRALVLLLAYFVLLFIAGRWLIPRLLRLSSKWQGAVPTTTMALIICWLLAYLADYFGLSAVIGAFFAGLSMSLTPFKKIINQSITQIGYAVFIPVFLASIGLRLTLTGILQDFTLFLILTIGGIVSKLLGAGLGARLSGFNRHSALAIGAGMISRGEMALVVAQMGLQNHLLSAARYSAVIGAIIMTTVLAPFFLKAALASVARHSQS
ncbi:cation:proton antiporter [Bombilactobacillus mellifer]|uniref:cation:proton antiporter n=1 Tax=Bombilactobacillus mellifer TaxID=1218492 RepID=UPI0023EFB13F|nr:cation:proton antiporter [Bombilactobacillus mellifer]MCT6827038.1 cation:proton antiporter [Bombilactobacillus mellifer]